MGDKGEKQGEIELKQVKDGGFITRVRGQTHQKSDLKTYRPPKAVKPGDIRALDDLDIRKLAELKEAFHIFDINNDGFIDESDLRGTFLTMGHDADDSYIKQMLSEAKQPIDFESFAMMVGYRTIELEPEEVLVEALKMYDEKEQGAISEERLFRDLTTYADRLTVDEAVEALMEAPYTSTEGKERRHLLEHDMDHLIDYESWIIKFAGFRKFKKEMLLEEGDIADNYLEENVK